MHSKGALVPLENESAPHPCMPQIGSLENILFFKFVMLDYLLDFDDANKGFGVELWIGCAIAFVGMVIERGCHNFSSGFLVR